MKLLRVSSRLLSHGTPEFGDSPGRLPFKAGTIPRNYLDLLECALEEAFPASNWTRSSFNFMLHKSGLGFLKQIDSYSCNVYVIAAIPRFSDGHGLLTNDDFSNYESTCLTERFRHGCCQSA